MSNEHVRKRNFVCPYCHAKQELPPSRPRKVQCANCDMMVKLGEGKSRRSKKETSEPFWRGEPSGAEGEPASADSPAIKQPEEAAGEQSDEELFPEQRPVDLDTSHLLEDKAARGRHVRKRQDDEFMGRIKSVDEEDKVHWKRKKVRPLDEKKASAEDNWDEDSSDDGSNSQRSRSRVLPMIAAGGLFAAVVTIVAVSLSGLKGTDDQTPPAVAGEQNSVPADYVAARQVIEGFLQAESVDELVGYIRDPDRVEPLARQYYTEKPFETIAYKPVEDLDGLIFDGRYLELVIDLIGFENRSIVLEQIGTEYRVDWESWVGYSATSWDDFIEQRMTEPRLFRVMIGPDSYYNHKYSDPLDYGCYRLEDQLGDHRLYAYVPLESPLAKHLNVAFLKAPFGVAMVKICFPTDNPNDSLGNQVEIAEFVRFGWAERSD